MTESELQALPKTAEEARTSQSPHYYTGKPCKRGHLSLRLTSSGTCLECSRQHYSKSVTARESVKRYQSTPQAKTARDYYRKSPYAVSAYFSRTYGISLNEYNELKSLQNNKCIICECSFIDEEEDKRRNGGAHVDHCHHTGRIRGLLCSSCNKAIGLFKDNVASLERAIKYLNYYKTDDVVS